MIMIVLHRDDNELKNGLFGLSSTILTLQMKRTQAASQQVKLVKCICYEQNF